MSDKLRDAIHRFFVDKGIAQPGDPSLADDLAEQLKEKPPGWDWGLWQSAKANFGFLIALIGITATGLMLGFITDKIILASKCDEKGQKGLFRCFRCDQHLVGSSLKTAPSHQMWAVPEPEG